MPIPTNISPATAIALTVDVPHTTLAADVELAPDGTGFTSNCKNTNPQYNALWYKYTLPTGINYVRMGCQVASTANYDPYGTIWQETSPGVYTRLTFSWNQMCNPVWNLTTGKYMSFSLLGLPGDVFYLQVQNGADVTVDADLKVIVEHAPDLPILVDDCVIVPDDHYPYPAAIISYAAQDIINYVYHKKWSGESYSVIQATGHLAFDWWYSGIATEDATVWCYGPPPTWPEIGRVDLTPYKNRDVGVDLASDQVSKHYSYSRKSGVQTLVKIDAVTATIDQTWTIPTLLYKLVGVHTATNIAYFVDGDTFTRIMRYDLTTETVLTDLIPDTYSKWNGFVLPNGNVGLYDEDASIWKIYTSAGVLVTSFTKFWHRFSLDNDLTGLWFWENDQNSFTHVPFSTGFVDKTIDCPKIVNAGGPSEHFGFASSCPVLTYPLTDTPVTPPADRSGIYFVNPDKTRDIYYTEDKKIPNPTIKTALIGE